MSDDQLTDSCLAAFEAYQGSLGDRFKAAPMSYAVGRVWELVGRPDAALEAYQQALTEATAQPWLFLLNAVARCSKATKQEEAMAVWLAERALKAPPMPELGFLSGHLFRIVGQPEQGLRVLRECLPSITVRLVSYWATRELMGVLATLGQFAEAIDLAHESIASHTEKEAELRSDLAALLAACGRHEESLSEVE